MFRRRMLVEYSITEVTPTADGFEVELAQVFRTGSFMDQGNKRIRLAAEGDAPLAIVDEEMLASKVVEVLPPGLDQYAPALVGYRYVVLSANPSDRWAAGPTRFEWNNRVSLFLETSAVDAGRLPAAIARLAGRKLDLFDDGGKRCEATILGFRLVERSWQQERQKQAEGTRILAGQAWGALDADAAVNSVSANRHFLVADVGEAAECRDATWARSSALPPPVVARAVPADRALRKRALDAFRRLPAWREIQARFAAEVKGRWDDTGEGPPSVVVMRAAGASTGQVAVRARAGTGCDPDFDGHLNVVWEVRFDGATPVFSPRPTVIDDEWAVPTSAADVDGDGRPELLLHEKILRLRDGAYHLDELPEPFFCPC